MYAAEHAQEAPERAALVMAASGHVVTFADFEWRANRVARLFRGAGLRRGDHVAFLLENRPELMECAAGAERTGLYHTPINSHLGVDEVAYIVNDCEARVLITSAAMGGVASALPDLCPKVERWLIADAPGPAPYEPYDEVVGSLSGDPVPDEQLGTAMLYSSGTTGRPKGILRRVPEVHPGTWLPKMEIAQRLFGMRPGMTYLSPAPLYHSAPLMSVATALRLGATSVIMEGFDAAQFLSLVERYRITHTQVVPTMLSRLLRLPGEVRTGADVSSLECIVHAAAPCPVPIKEQIIDWFGPIVAEYYAASEANGATWCDSAEWLAHKGTVGRPLFGEVVILDDDGHDCPPGAVGTIWFRGATNFEYFKDPEQTSASRDASGEMSTVGDVGHLDDDGYLYLTDRKTMMIISGGVNIYPQETENLLLTHPKVEDAAVFGVPHVDLGEEVKAVVQLSEGVEPGVELERELIGYCRDRIAHIKCPRSIDFEETLPRLPTGKLAKRHLRDRYWQGRQNSLV